MAIIILCGLIYFMAIMVYIKPLEETNVPSMQVQELIDDPIKDLDADDMWLGYPKWGAVIVSRQFCIRSWHPSSSTLAQGLPKSFSSDVPDHEFVSVKLIMQSESTGAEEAPMNGEPIANAKAPIFDVVYQSGYVRARHFSMLRRFKVRHRGGIDLHFFHTIVHPSNQGCTVCSLSYYVIRKSVNLPITN